MKTLILFSLLFTACASKPKETEMTKAEGSLAGLIPESLKVAAEPVKQEVKVEIKKKIAELPKLTGPAAEIALGWLKNGNQRFKKGWFRKDGQSLKEVSVLSEKQKPHTTLLTCSDSRVPPELIFDQKFGEIYVVRNAGPNLSFETLASLETGVTKLGTRLVVVMAHNSCETIKAAFENKDSTDVGSENQNQLLSDIRERLAIDAKASPRFKDEALANAKGIAEDIAKRSFVLRRYIESKELKIVTAIYDLETSNVEF